MLYRAVDCGAYSLPNEPATIVWLSAKSRQAAGERLTLLLATVWDVPQEDVLYSNLTDELELERDSVQAPSAGPRRWLEVGSMGLTPFYDDFTNALVFANARDRARLAQAWFAARAHAAELAKDLKGAADARRAAGNEREAELLEWEAARQRSQGQLVVGEAAVGEALVGAWLCVHLVTEARSAKDWLEVAARRRAEGKTKKAYEAVDFASHRLRTLLARQGEA